MHRAPAGALLGVLLLTGTLTAQTVKIVRITDETTPIRGFGDRPALHDGRVAFLGTDTAGTTDAVFLTPADGQGPFTVVVDESTPIPNFPAETFRWLSNPTIHDGLVAFTGGHHPRDPWITDGVFAGDGGPLQTLYDATSFDPAVPPTLPSLGPQGVTWRVSRPSSSTVGAPQFTNFAGASEPTWAHDLPGGGVWAGMLDLNSNPAFGGGTTIYSLLVSHDRTSDVGVYAYDVVSKDLEVVANWTTPLPGTSDTFESYSYVDTDGLRAAFVGGRGPVYSGGVQGVYVAGLDSDAGNDVQKIAQNGEPAPGSGLSFGSFGDVAIEGELVVFHAFLDGGSDYGIYGWSQGQLFKIVDSTDRLFGQEIRTLSMSFRGLDQTQLVFRTASGAWNSEFGLYVAHIDVPICQENLGYGGPGTTTLEVCGEPLEPGNAAELTVAGAAPSAPSFLLLSLEANPTPFGAGTLVAVPWLVALPFTTDAAGELTLPFNSPDGGPLDLVAQLAVADPRWPANIDLSNTLWLRLLP